MNLRDVVYCRCEHPDGIEFQRRRPNSLGPENEPTAAAQLARLIIDNQLGVTNAEACQGIWGHREDGGPLSASNTITKLICQIRKALRPGVRIVSTPGKPTRYVLAIDLDHPLAERSLLEAVSRRLAAPPVNH